jgi:rubrerythrin
MPFDFNADNILEVAQQLERNGAKFYRQAADAVSDPSNKAFLSELADMEVDHEATFEAMRAELSQHEKAGTVFTAQADAAVYLQALADTRVFFEKKMDPQSIENIYKTAITAEKDSIVFYLGLQDMVSEALGKERIDQIIQEEKDHLRLLSQKLIELKT